MGEWQSTLPNDCYVTANATVMTAVFTANAGIGKEQEEYQDEDTTATPPYMSAIAQER